MYSELRLFEPKITNFKTQHHFLHRINKGFQRWRILHSLLYSLPLRWFLMKYISEIKLRLKFMLALLMFENNEQLGNKLQSTQDNICQSFATAEIYSKISKLYFLLKIIPSF